MTVSRTGFSGDLGYELWLAPQDAEQLWDALQELAPLGPTFVSVTYGAGGSTRERTHATVARIIREFHAP